MVDSAMMNFIKHSIQHVVEQEQQNKLPAPAKPKRKLTLKEEIHNQSLNNSIEPDDETKKGAKACTIFWTLY